jgi:hypothetical protein
MDIIKLEAIIDNLHTWAMRELRPWISQYLDLWLLRHPLPSPVIFGSGVEPGDLEDQADESAMTLYARHDNNMSEEARETSEEENLRALLRDLLSSHHEGLMSGLKAFLETSFESWTQGSRPRQTVATSSTQTDLDADWTHNKPIADRRLGTDSGMPSENRSETNHFMQPGMLEKTEARRRELRRATRTSWTQTYLSPNEQPAGWDHYYDPFRAVRPKPRFGNLFGPPADDKSERSPELWSSAIWVKSASTQSGSEIFSSSDEFTIPSQSEKLMYWIPEINLR